MRHTQIDTTTDHTPLDTDNLRERGINPNRVQPRKRSTICSTCFTPGVWNLSGKCDRHWTPPATAIAPTCEEAAA